MSILFKIVGGLFALFVVMATWYGWFLVGGPVLVVLVPVAGYVAYILWRKMM